MKFLALEQDIPGIRGEQFSPHLREEAAKIYELYQRGLVREMYFRQNQSEAVLVMECQDSEEAQAALNELPLVQVGLIAFDLIPLKPYPGFDRLFNLSENDQSDG
jgi:hypothetical protein